MQLKVGGIIFMRLAVIIPTRRDRPEFLENSLRMLRAQQLPGWLIDPFLMDAPGEPGVKDITRRYRLGYEATRGKGYDLIALWEDDDWYAPNYLAEMIAAWYFYDKPQIFGTGYTIYYHLRLRRWLVMQHPARASAMNTLLLPDLPINWPADNDPYTDIHLWKQLKGVTFKPGGHYPEPGKVPALFSMGIKHGLGLCGGRNHNDWLDRFIYPDPDFKLPESVMDSKSLSFYEQMSLKLQACVYG